jgi:HEAT repeat protein
MSNLLEQAQTAIQQENWSQLSQLLQQRLLEADEPLNAADSEQVMSLALLVLEAGDFQERWDIAKIFPAFGDKAIQPLIDLLQDDEVELESRWFAARILSEFDSPATLQSLIEILKSAEDEDLSTMAAEALANLGPSAIDALVNSLANADTRLLAVQSLAKIRHSDTIPALLTVVDDPQALIRATAIDALGSFHDSRVPPVLLQGLTDSAAIVRKAAIASLGVRSDLALELDLVKRFYDRLWDLNLEVCQQAAIALGRIGTDEAVEGLFQVLKSPHTPLVLRLEAVRALGWAETDAALKCLQQAFLELPQLETSSLIYTEIAATLGRWAEPERMSHVAEILIGWLNSTHPAITHSSVKQAIALSLGHLKQSQAIEPLTQLLADEDTGVRLHAIAALKALNSEASLQHLKTLATQENLSQAMKQGVTIALQEWSQ